MRSNNRKRRSEIAQETMDILSSKEYEYSYPSDPSYPSSQHQQQLISIASELDASCAGTVVLDLETTKTWMMKGSSSSSDDDHCNNTTTTTDYPTVTVLNTTTFTAAKDIITKKRQGQHNDDANTNANTNNDANVCCLNFASAKNPGGGFLGGSQAQEESLARASGLYNCLLQAPTYYNTNRSACNSKSTLTRGIYEDLIIYSPNVPVFRNVNDELLEEPWVTSIITAPAPNRGAIMNNFKDKKLPSSQKKVERKKKDVELLIQEAFEVRIDMVLSTAMNYGHRDVVLGAWGCGVFQNDSRVIANLFKRSLMKESFKGAFDDVVFAVLDYRTGCPTFNAFYDVLSNFPEEEICS